MILQIQEIFRLMLLETIASIFRLSLSVTHTLSY